VPHSCQYRGISGVLQLTLDDEEDARVYNHRQGAEHASHGERGDHKGLGWLATAAHHSVSPSNRMVTVLLSDT
jgi:hypothetical protein